MKCKVTLLFSIVLFQVFYSCNKEESVKKVFAGIYDSDFIYREFSPPLEIPVVWDEQNLYGSGSINLDFGSDSSNDYFIKLNVLNMDSIHLIQGNFPNPFPGCYIENAEGVESAVYTEITHQGHGSTITSTWADTIKYGSWIGTNLRWSGSKSTVPMWGENPHQYTLPSFGSWYYVRSVRYLGLKYHGKYGWLEVDATEPYHPVFLKFAIQK